jgi:hypothetical protein
MLLHDTNDGYVAISQPAHAWVSGQLAAAWGNDHFGQVEPRDEVCLAAEQHDIGWLGWEANPALNPATGKPRTFMELPTSEHVTVWETAGPDALVYGPYVALLVSMHGTGLYQRHDFNRDNDEEAAAARRFIKNGAEFEDRLRRHLADESYYSRFSAPDMIARNSRLIAVWDAMSLMLCGGFSSTREITRVPATDEAMTISLNPDSATSRTIVVKPWPFSSDDLNLTVTGRWLNETFSDQPHLRAALQAAPWRVIRLRLVPG